MKSHTNLFWFLTFHIKLPLVQPLRIRSDTTHDTTHRTAREGREPFFSTLPLPPAHQHSDIYLQLCT